MSVIKVTLPPGEIPADGKMVSFKAPCTCTVTDGIEIEGVTYTVCDALGKCVTGIGGVWDVGSIVTVTLSLEQKKAYIQNSSGFVKKSGDTMTGNLGISKSLPQVNLTNTSTSRTSRLTADGTSTKSAVIMNVADDSNSSAFFLYPETAALKNAARLRHRVGGADTWYDILHTGNRDLVVPRYTATVSTSWTASGNYFYQDVAVSGILATDTPIIGINPGSDNAANVNYSLALSNVFRITTSANSIRVWARAKPTVAIPIQIKVVR